MNKLNDEELKQVGGGVTWLIDSLDAGDVFIRSDFPQSGVVITQSYQNLAQDSNVNTRNFNIGSDNTPRVLDSVGYVTIISLQKYYTYSPALTGTIPYD